MNHVEGGKLTDAPGGAVFSDWLVPIGEKPIGLQPDR